MKSVIYASQSFDFLKSIIFFKFGFFQLVRIKYCVLLLADSHLLQKHSNVSSSEFKRTSWTEVHWSLRNFNGTSVAKWCCLGFRLIPQIHLQIYLSKCLPQSRSWITFAIFMAKVKISNFLNSCWHTVCLWRLLSLESFISSNVIIIISSPVTTQGNLAAGDSMGHILITDAFFQSEGPGACC